MQLAWSVAASRSSFYHLDFQDARHRGRNKWLLFNCFCISFAKQRKGFVNQGQQGVPGQNVHKEKGHGLGACVMNEKRGAPTTWASRII